MTCEHPFVEASADHSVAVDAPAMARQLGACGCIEKTMFERSSVSSPSPILNQAALAAAKTMTYTPGVYRCAREPHSRALFRIDFMPRRSDQRNPTRFFSGRRSSTATVAAATAAS